MSGTPVENRLWDYWSIVDFAQSGYLGGLAYFGRAFVSATDRDSVVLAGERCCDRTSTVR